MPLALASEVSWIMVATPERAEMEVARDDAGDLFTIEMIRGKATPPPLWCPGELPTGEECGAKVQAKALHSRLMAAHFAARHEPGCDGASGRSEDQPGDAGTHIDQGLRPVRWKMRLLDDGESHGPDGRHRPDDRVPGHTTRRRRADAARGFEDTADDREFSTLLLNILAGTIPANLELVIGTLAPQAASDLIVAAVDADAETYEDQSIILWGEVKQVVPSPYGSLFLKLRRAADDVAILVDKTNMKRRGIDESTDLVGRHAIAYGKYVVSDTSGRAHLRVESGSLAFNPILRRPRKTAGI
ncbi:hypothetical protein [Microbacterium paraoxydans]|uniref:hypothetical protein n=1 Tax=Microbacterium paraoxydans TaxID=199592 RepID=UPI0013B424AF|nr:hypothetical protein [Microbacterium paraoxydans]